MHRALIFILVTMLTLNACSGQRDNTPLPPKENPNDLLPKQESIFRRQSRKNKKYEGTPVDQITSAVLEPTLDGAILLVEGLPLRQGAFDVRLILDNEINPGTETFVFSLKALQPTDEPQGPDYLRKVKAGAHIPQAELKYVRTIRILGARNEHVLRR